MYVAEIRTVVTIIYLKQKGYAKSKKHLRFSKTDPPRKRAPKLVSKDSSIDIRGRKGRIPVIQKQTDHEIPIWRSKMLALGGSENIWWCIMGFSTPHGSPLVVSPTLIGIWLAWEWKP